MNSDTAGRIRAALDAYTDRITESPAPQLLDQQPWLRRWAGPITAALVVAAVIAATFTVRAQLDGHSDRTVAPAGVSAQVREKLWSVARSWADDNGDKGAIIAEAVATSHSRAENFLEAGSAGGSDQSAVWVLQIHGAFVCGCSGPVGFKSPTGNTTVVVVNYNTYVESDWSFSNSAVNLSQLGTVIVLTG
jgi:hypothetical protein